MSFAGCTRVIHLYSSSYVPFTPVFIRSFIRSFNGPNGDQTKGLREAAALDMTHIQQCMHFLSRSLTDTTRSSSTLPPDLADDSATNEAPAAGRLPCGCIKHCFAIWTAVLSTVCSV